MRTILASSLVLLLLILAVGFSRGGIVNLVPNGSFEKPDPQQPDRPEGFAVSRHDAVVGATSQGGVFTWEETGHWGKRSVAIENKTREDFGNWQATVPVKPETSYTLSVYTRCQSESGAPEIVVAPAGKSFQDPGGHDFYLPAVREWNEYQQTFKTVAGQTTLTIALVLYNRPNQKVWFDDLSLVETASLPQFTISWPEPGAVLSPGEVEFLYQPVGQAASYVLEYARDPYFTRGVVQVGSLETTRFRPPQPPAAGTWYWHLGVTDDSGRPHFSPPQAFLISRGGSLFQHADTTPPAVFRPQPAPDSTVEGANPVISACFSETCSGVATGAARLLLDGREVTREAKVSSEGITYRPPVPLAKSLHRVEVTVNDAAGNRSNALAWRFGVGVPVQVTGRFDKQGRFLLNGQPYFPVGLYSYCCNPGTGVFGESLMARAADAGLGAELVEDVGSQDTLGMFLKHGMKVMLQVGGGLRASADEEKAKEALVTKGAVQWKAHPALLGYWADEPDSLAPEVLARGYATIKSNDPDHPAVWCLCQPEKYKQNSVSLDAIMPDIYPVPTTPLSVIYTQLQKAAQDSGGKPVWFIPQAFDWKITSGGKVNSPAEWRPTAAEIRAMTYLGIVAGAKGIFYWASDTASTNDIVWYAAQWDEVLRIGGELRYLGNVLAGGPRAANVKVETTGEGLYHAVWADGERQICVVVNSAQAPVEAEFTWPESKRVRCLFEDRSLPKPTRQFSDLFRPYEVHVYELR